MFGAALGAEVGNAPAEVDGVEPEGFAWFRVGAEPFLEVAVGGLPVLPVDGGLVDGAAQSAEVVDVEGL